MKRRTFLMHVFAVTTMPVFLSGCLAAGGQVVAESEVAEPEGGPLGKSLEEWRTLLPADAYAVLFEENTEAPFSSPLLDEHRVGTFICAACNFPLFSSTTKYESGTGWPSFYESLPDSVGTKVDNSFMMTRTEYHCARCSGHQGHLFDDGPAPTGKRYCNNGLALLFVPEEESLPALRS